MHSLSNIDKHRLLLNAALANMHGIVRASKNLIPGKLAVHSGIVKGRAKIATYQAERYDAGEEMNMKFMPIVEVVFDCSCISDGESVQSTLTCIVRRVAEVIATLDQFF